MSGKTTIESGRAALGIEFGSTRIKAVLIGENHEVLATGGHTWENHLENGLWTYPLSEIVSGLQSCYGDLKRDAFEKYGIKITSLSALGVSAMMHGYLAFNDQMELLTPFRTWRNTNTGKAAGILTERLHFNIPLRWSAAHLYEAILDGEAHVKDIAHVTTLAGYAHWLLTGEKALGVGDASGMFPIGEGNNYDQGILDIFDQLTAQRGFTQKIRALLPKVLPAGAQAGALTGAGARLLDPDGDLMPGAPVCPPEGDAGTGMTATNSVFPRTGNVSAGTSVFAMIVLEKPLSAVHPEIDMVTTPDGAPVAMAHCNNCTSDLNAWAGLMREFAARAGLSLGADELYGLLLRGAMEGDKDCGGLVSYNYFSGEPVTGLDEGRPALLRLPDARFTLDNFMRAQLFSSLAALKIGMDILTKDEKVAIDRLCGHGGLFRTKGAGQSALAAALRAPVTVMETAGEGGAWGMALLARYMVAKADHETLSDYLDHKVFAGMPSQTIAPDPADAEGFDQYMKRYIACLPVEKAAVEALK